MKFKFFFLVIFASTTVYAQEMNKIIVDKKSGKEILVGFCNREGLNSEIFADFFTEGYYDYTPDPDVIKKIKKLKKDLKITVVMATWCYDSKVQVPVFYKIMDGCRINESGIQLICVDRYKTGGEADVSALDIQRVPTFIFYKSGREIGRIVETPTSLFEKNVLLILSMGS